MFHRNRTLKSMARYGRWLLGCGAVFAVALAACAWWINSMMAKTFRMSNMVYQEAISPDGKYAATLAYRDGLTSGFYYVSLQPKAGWHHLQPDDPILHDEIAEVAAEGLESLAWTWPRILIIDYDKSGADKTQFVIQKKSWRDVRIAYRGS